MGENTSIEWATHTFNSHWGCARVSPACENCYAETFAKRVGHGARLPQIWGVNAERKFFGDKHWAEPLKWNAAAEKAGERHRVFCSSMADVFEDREDLIAVRARLAALIANTPALDWLLLTKRPENMVRLAEPFWPKAWPENVWAGTTVENQKYADKRIPVLLKVPAAVRFLSCEPLLGAIDLKGWGDQAPSPVADDAPELWADFVWPEWMPIDTRTAIENFWSASNGRGPKSWLRDHVVQHVPATGARVICSVDGHGWATTNKMATDGVEGRYIHLWNNIGRVLTDDGKSVPTSGGHGSGWLSKWLTKSGSYAPRLHWIISGGESGPGARAMDLDWVRSLRDQCIAAGVAFHFKQVGGVRKKLAGRELDGRTWDDVPS